MPEREILKLEFKRLWLYAHCDKTLVMATIEKTYRRDRDESRDDIGRSSSRMKVVVRIRPETEAEIRTAYPVVVKAVDDHVLVFDPRPDNTPTVGQSYLGGSKQFKKPPLQSKKYKDLRLGFDRVFDATGTQMELFEHTTKDVIDDLLSGINCSVFAYGATGAGKTYTMLGDSSSPGVMFYTMMELYTRINELKDEKICEVGVSYLEIYNETICDLIVPSGALELREDYNQGLVVSGLTMHQPKTADEILNFLVIGNRNRTQHPTDANATSSRSHAVFQVYVNQKSRTSGVSTMVTQGKLSLIDLAGSERATVTTNSGARLREGANINKSLLALGNCINALAENKGKGIHIPYRNSKLTRLLKDSLGGNCRTVMITNVSPSGLSYEDTYNTLKYADRAKQIKTSLARNVVNVDLHVTKYRSIIQDLEKEVAELKQKLHVQTKPSHLAGPVYNCADVIRLEEMVYSVYGERSHLRKTMSDLDAAEREILLRVYRKERDLERIRVSSNCDARRTKTQSQMEAAQCHLMEVQRKKQAIHDQLQSNRDSINRLQCEINLAITSAGSQGSALKRHMEMVVEARKLDVEGAHQWKQIKHLLKYIKGQEREISKTEKLLLHALELACRQHQFLASSHLGVPPHMDGLYLSLLQMAEREKEVLWADQSFDSQQQQQDTSAILAQSQRNILDTMAMYCSPNDTKKKDSPLTSLGGILAKRSYLSLATELSSSDADSSITGVSCQSSHFSRQQPTLVAAAPERHGGVVMWADHNHRRRPPGGRGEGAVGIGCGSTAGCTPRGTTSSVEVEEEVGTGVSASSEVATSRFNKPAAATGLASHAAGWLGGMGAAMLSSGGRTLRTADGAGPQGSGCTAPPPKQTKVSSDLHRPGDSQPPQGVGHLGPAKPAEQRLTRVLSTGSAFRPPSSQQPSGGAPNLVRRSSSLSRATMIRSPPPPTRSHAEVTPTTATMTTKAAPPPKSLPPSTPHIPATSQPGPPLGFDDNFVSPVVLRPHHSAFSRPSVGGNVARDNTSLRFSTPQRRTLDTSCTGDHCPKDTASSSSPQAVHGNQSTQAVHGNQSTQAVHGNQSTQAVHGNQLVTSPMPSLALPTRELQDPGLSLPSHGRSRTIVAPDLNSTFTMEAHPLHQSDPPIQVNSPPRQSDPTTQGNSPPRQSDPPTQGNSPSRTTTSTIFITGERSGQHSSSPLSGDVLSESTDPRGNGPEHHSPTVQAKKVPSFMALTKSATYKRVQSAWTRMNINKENEVTAGPVVVRSLSRSKRLQSLSGSNPGNQLNSIL